MDKVQCINEIVYKFQLFVLALEKILLHILSLYVPPSTVEQSVFQQNPQYVKHFDASGPLPNSSRSVPHLIQIALSCCQWERGLSNLNLKYISVLP